VIKTLSFLFDHFLEGVASVFSVDENLIIELKLLANGLILDDSIVYNFSNAEMM
jgi:hypothetical protein